MINQLAISRKEILTFYSPYSFIRELDTQVVFEITIIDSITNEHNLKEEITIENEVHIFIYKPLKWDSDFFGKAIYKLEFVLFNHSNIDILVKAISKFASILKINKNNYCYIETPAEDNLIIQALNLSGFKLIETRLHHILKNLDSYKQPRYKARVALESDINNISETARGTKNRYDRFHSDILIDNNLADDYLATYAANAIKGFCDFVLVPNDEFTPVKAFMAASIMETDSQKLDTNIGRLQLSAVDKACKGWYIKLASESIYKLKEMNAKYILVTTQATNRAAFYSSEKLGFNLGGVTHVFSI
jgi:dTDP-4-amino-4,6-dideoxy-D-galactose acyltransferase